MHVGLNYIYPFLSAACITFTCRLGEGAAERGREAAVIGSVVPASEASLLQDCSIACSGPSGFGSSPDT